MTKYVLHNVCVREQLWDNSGVSRIRGRGVLKRKVRPCPLIFLKVRSSPVVARWAEARCETSYSFLLG